MSRSSTDVTMILAHIEQTIGDRTSWVRWPGGWPGDIESALIDAVFSARAVYHSKHGKGIGRDVVVWRDARTRSHFTLDALLAEIDSVGVAIDRNGWPIGAFQAIQRPSEPRD